MIGIDMTAIQALEKRTGKIEELEQKNNKLEKNNAALLTRMNEMAAEIKKLQLTLETVVQQQKNSKVVLVKNNSQ